MRNHKTTTNEEMAPDIQAHVTSNPSQDNFGSHGNSHIGKIMCCFEEKKTKDTSGSLNSCQGKTHRCRVQGVLRGHCGRIQECN